MKQLKNLWLRIPRPVRAICNILLILVVLTAFYISIDTPTLNERHAFRRQERANLLGPSTILFDEDVEDYRYGHLIVGETEKGILTFVNDSWNGFNYHEKTGDITVVSAPKWWFDWGSSDFAASLPVFVFHEYPEATNAWLILDIEGIYTHNLNGENLNEKLDHVFGLSAFKGEDGFFYFSIDIPSHSAEGSPRDAASGLADDGYALDMLAQHFTNAYRSTSPYSNCSITATVTLLDKNHSLIVEREMVLREMDEDTE